jgi:hypothetical protein
MSCRPRDGLTANTLCSWDTRDKPEEELVEEARAQSEDTIKSTSIALYLWYVGLINFAKGVASNRGMPLVYRLFP